ncbi:MAG: hypothetical protein E6X17_13260 [Sporomusaceae bacterium]|nr:hypothetical protein [Sporomusaceae bacterium]
MKGAVIASEAEADKNKLSTDTLTFGDIKNKAEYSASSIGVNLDTRKITQVNEAGLTPNIGVPAADEADSTTKAAISPGTIDVRSGNTDLSGLSRDPNKALNALSQIFDKKTVAEQQELAKVFGEEAFKLVHKISEDNKWEEGSPQKIALHAFVGAVMAQLGGGDVLAGAAGAGLNEAVQGELAKIKDPAVHQWASTLVGAAAAEVVGGNAQTGGATAASGTKNNLYWERINPKGALEESGLNPEQVKELLAKFDEATPLDTDAIKQYAEFGQPDDYGMGYEGDLAKRDTLLVMAMESGYLNDQQLERLASNLDTQLSEKKSEHNKAVLDSAFDSVLIVTGVGELKALYNAGKIGLYMMRYQGTSRATTIVADEVKVLSQSPWNQGPTTRGNIIDDALGNNLGRTFPTVDKLENGVLTSTKSVDLAAKTYQTEAGLYNRLKTDIDSLKNFTEARRNGVTVTPEKYQSKVFELALPETIMSTEQLSALSKAIQYAEKNNIGVRIVVVK